MINEAKPRNIKAIPMIKAIGLRIGPLPVGHIALFLENKRPLGWIAIEHQFLSCELFADLYSHIGDVYCPRYISRELPPTAFQQFKKRIGLDIRPRIVMIDNPEYRPGYFRLPNLYPLNAGAYGESNFPLAHFAPDLPTTKGKK